MRQTADAKGIESSDDLGKVEPFQPDEWAAGEYLLLPKEFVTDPDDDDDDDPPPSTPPPGNKEFSKPQLEVLW